MWCSQCAGELLKLGYRVSATTIRSVLREQRVPPVSRRGGLAWRAFLGAQARAVLACDFFSVETLRLQTLYALFFLELRTRRVFLAACTERPSAAWVTQQARNLVWDLEEADVEAALLIRDRDSKFTPAFVAIFSSPGVRVVRTPVRAPQANASAESWVVELEEHRIGSGAPGALRRRLDDLFLRELTDGNDLTEVFP